MKNKFFAFAVAAVMAFFAAGCQTLPPSTVGFPLIDIVDAEVDVANDSKFAQDEVEWKRGPNTRVIGGTLGSKITPKDITIRLIDTSIQVPIKEGEDVSAWFLNIPTGLKATAHALEEGARFAAVKGATEITVTIDGIPERTINQAIKIRVPYEKTNRSWDFHIPPDDDKRFEVYGVDVSAVVVDGAVNRKIDTKTFTIGFGGTKLAAGISLDTDITSWFTNIPRGLKAVAAEEAAEGQQLLTVTISGTPVIQWAENIKVVIPAAVTTAEIALEIPPSDKARYDIGSFSAVASTDIELRTGSNWKGTIKGEGLTGPEVFQLKDFTAVAIIQITAQSEYKLGEDGAYHWTGDSITYGKLMAEARRLNAHAIIDVVIDDDDQVDEVIERRHVEANHVPTPLELIKMDTKKYPKPLITVEDDPNDPKGGKIYVERIEVIKRTSTGTALAITYAPASPPVIGEGNTAGYVPAVPTILGDVKTYLGDGKK